MHTLTKHVLPTMPGRNLSGMDTRRQQRHPVYIFGSAALCRVLDLRLIKLCGL